MKRFIKWKMCECVSPTFPDGYIIIKEDTQIEYPIALVPYPLGKHKNGTIRQQKHAQLIAAAPELLRACKEALRYVTPEESAFDLLITAVRKADE